MIHEQKTEIHRSIPPVCPFAEGERVKCLGVERTISLIEPHDGSNYRIHFLPVENEPLRCLWPCGGDGRTLQKITEERPACPFKPGDIVMCNGQEAVVRDVEPRPDDPANWLVGFTHPLDSGIGAAVWPSGVLGRSLRHVPKPAPAEPPQHRPDPTSTYVAELAGHLLDSIHLTRNRIRVELERCYSTRANVGLNHGGTVDYGAFLRLQTLANKLLGDLAEQANRIDELTDADEDTVNYGV